MVRSCCCSHLWRLSERQWDTTAATGRGSCSATRRVHAFACGSASTRSNRADGCSNRVRGEWFKVHDFDATLYRRCRDEMFGWAPDEPPVTAFAVTVVGPARVGSTLAVVKAFEASNIGVLAYASESLTEISIAHMVVPVAPARLDRVADVNAVAEPLEQGLRQLARNCGLTPRSRASTQSRVDFA